MKKALFICGRNRLRSPTAEQIFSTWENVEADSAGLDNDADVQLSLEQIVWADVIFVMEKRHREKLSKKYRDYLKNKRVICLDIQDNYAFMDSALVRLLTSKVGAFLR